jgi:hypothetical protein
MTAWSQRLKLIAGEPPGTNSSAARCDLRLTSVDCARFEYSRGGAYVFAQA